MDVADLREHLLVQTPKNEVLKVSTVYPPSQSGTGYVTAEVVFPVPPRTTVRSFTLNHVAAWREPSEAILARYERAWGFR